MEKSCYPPKITFYYNNVFLELPPNSLYWQHSSKITKSQRLFLEKEFGNGGCSYLQSNSFEDFDEFTGNLVQYLASNSKRKRLEVAVESLYLSNAPIRISAFYTDKNYQFDPRASLLFSRYQYRYKGTTRVSVFFGTQFVSSCTVENLFLEVISIPLLWRVRKGCAVVFFLISEARIEAQFTKANATKLNRLAKTTGGKRLPFQRNYRFD